MKNPKPSLSALTAALQQARRAKTSSLGNDWPADNPARGQCVPSSLVVQDYYGGDLLRFAVHGNGINEDHYCNILNDGTLLDTTRSQYKVLVTLKAHPVNLGNYASVREKRLAHKQTRTRYEILKRRVALILNLYLKCPTPVCWGRASRPWLVFGGGR